MPLVSVSAEINQCVRPAWRYYLLFWPPRRSARVLGVLARGVLGLLTRTLFPHRRRLPSHIVLRKLPARWTCDMNVWDADRAVCAVDAEARPDGSAFRARGGGIIFDGGG